MAARSIWKGAITFSMLSIPVRLYVANESKDLSFNQLHAGCGARVKQQRICPVHDQVLEAADIERGYEISKGSYVTLSDDDLSALILPSLRTIDLSQFVAAREIDPVYFEKTYWLEPEPIGARPYALLRQAIEARNLVGIGTLTLRTHERMIALRSGGGTLVLDTLFYPDEIRPRVIEPEPAVSPAEMDLALSLVDTLTAPFNPAEHTDAYRTALLQLIEQRSKGIIVAPTPLQPAPSAPQDLMSQLQAAIVQAKSAREEKSA